MSPAAPDELRWEWWTSYSRPHRPKTRSYKALPIVAGISEQVKMSAVRYMSIAILAVPPRHKLRNFRSAVPPFRVPPRNAKPKNSKSIVKILATSCTNAVCGEKGRRGAGGQGPAAGGSSGNKLVLWGRGNSQHRLRAPKEKLASEMGFRQLCSGTNTLCFFFAKHPAARASNKPPQTQHLSDLNVYCVSRQGPYGN